MLEENIVQQLLAEQKRTNETLARLEKAGTLDKFVELVPECEPKWDEDPFNFADSWDLDDLETTRSVLMGEYLVTVEKNLQLFKYAKDYVHNLYKHRIREWEQYRNWCKENGREETLWATFVSNPDCLKFFEDYERVHNIKDSTYKQAMKVVGNGNTES